MRVQLLRNPAAELGCRIQEGEIGEVDAPIGRRLVSLGIAVELEEPKPAPVLRAIPDEPAIAEAKPVDIAPKREALPRQQSPRKAAVLPVQPHRKKDL